jgi:hypothetical protein
MSAALDRLRDALKAHGCEPTDRGKAKCPAHNDDRASLSFGPGENDRVLVHCFAGCETKDVMAALGLTLADLAGDASGNGVSRPPGVRETWKSKGETGPTAKYTASWLYRDANGRELGVVARYDGTSGKVIIPYFKREENQWKPGAAPSPRPLYNLDGLAAQPDAPVLVVEGEKCAAAINRFCRVAVTSPNGAEAASRADWTPLRGRRVIVWPDNDAPGAKYGAAVAHLARKAGAASVRSIDVTTLGLPAGGDVVDWIAAHPGTGLRDLEALVTIPATETTHRIEIIGADELARTELPEPNWAVPGLIPEGATILAGPPKVGKSWLALATAWAVASGGFVLGSIRVEPGEALYFGLEDTKRRLKARLAMLGMGEAQPPGLLLTTNLPRLDAGGTEALREVFGSRPMLRLAVIDTLARVRPERRRGGDIYAEDAAMVASLQRLAFEYGIALLLVTHTRKANPRLDGDALETVTGTSGLTGAADAVAVLRRGRLNRTATLAITGRDLEERELALTFSPDSGTWAIVGDAAEVARTDEQRAVIETLRKWGSPTGMRPQDIATAIPKSVSAVKMQLHRMVDAGLVVRVGRGSYTLPVTTVTGVTTATPVPGAGSRTVTQQESDTVTIEDAASSDPDGIPVPPVTLVTQDTRNAGGVRV